VQHVVNGLIQNVDLLDEPEAMAAIVWIIGEFTHKIDNPVAIMERFVTGFKEEPAEVQQQVRGVVEDLICLFFLLR
jgi:vesicle coat complex subunit